MPANRCITDRKKAQADLEQRNQELDSFVYIGNGIKHHDAEDGSIQISSEDRGDCYEFAIADNGPGIAPEHHDRMFKIFQAVNPQNRSDSTGIGLAIVKKIVEAEGGTIWLESELGKGTTFYFTWLQRTVDS